VYVLKSEKDGNLYVGCTSNIENRLSEHNAGRVPSTKGRQPLKLVYSESFGEKHEAFFTEQFYKTARGKKELLKKLK